MEYERGYWNATSQRSCEDVNRIGDGHLLAKMARSSMKTIRVAAAPTGVELSIVDPHNFEPRLQSNGDVPRLLCRQRACRLHHS